MIVCSVDIGEIDEHHCLNFLFIISCISLIYVLLQVMQLAGIEGEQVVLLLEDHQFIEPQFLEMINSLLSSGEVPGLYTPEELDPILGPLRDMASQAGFRGTMVNYFASSKFFSTSPTFRSKHFVCIY